LAQEKTEVILLTGKCTAKKIRITVGNTIIEIKKSIGTWEWILIIGYGTTTWEDIENPYNT
jgi:hypothetical protein